MGRFRVLSLAVVLSFTGAALAPAFATHSSLTSESPLATAPSVRSSGSWRWPLAAPHPILRPFVAPATPYSSGHRGLDIGAESNEVVAPADGVVRFAGVVVDRPVLSIQHSGGLISSYEPVASALSAGDPVARGDVVGTVIPGHCPRLCLHFGVRLDGEYVSPLNYLGGIPWSVLVPTRGG